MNQRKKIQDYKKGKQIAQDWTPPSIEEMHRGDILGLDQSLTNTGWVLIRVHPSTGVKVLQKGLIKTQTDLKSFSGSYDKGTQLRRELAGLMTWEPEVVAYETPAVIGRRTESSFLAGYLVHQEATKRHVPTVKMVSAQHVRSVLGGRGCKDKNALKAVLENYIPGIASSRSWNEHNRDALGIALVAALEIGH